jgi:50S ribosomal protein L16 3-hydroxylase
MTLNQWIAPMSVTEFRTQHLRRVPFAAAGSASTIVSMLDWQTVGRVLERAAARDVLVVTRGQLLNVPPPRSLTEARAIMRTGTGFTVRRVARHDAALAHVAGAFTDDLAGQVDLHLFVTPGGTHGFGWHYDTEDVFLIQTAGCKDYYFRENTMVRGRPWSAPVDLTLYGQETSPMGTARLLPGDFLYIPARWWHVALCREDSLSLSLGVVPADYQEVP